MKFILFLIFSIIFLSCNDDDKFCKIIHTIYNDPDKSIDNFNYLFQLASKYPQCLESIANMEDIETNGVLDKHKFESVYFKTHEDSLKSNIKVNFFLENSESMHGFFKGQTDCEITISKILIHAGYYFGKENISFSFITDSIRQEDLNGDFTEFVKRLEPEELKKKGPYVNTKIADILKTVINHTSNDTLSLLTSDCIYSLAKGEDKTEAVNFEWSLIEEAFLDALKTADLSVLINKYISNFRGDYFSLLPNGREKRESGLGFKERFERPYYVIIIGENNLLKSMLQEIDFRSYAGYQNSYLISLPKPSDRIRYKIINSYKKGNFRPDKKDPMHSIVEASKSNRGSDKGQFQYTIAANISGLGVENDYLIDSSNYNVSGDYNISVVAITEKMTFEDPELSSYSHLISLSLTNNLKEEKILVSLRRETPSWILTTHTDSDLDLGPEYQHKTRGFGQFVNGIESAFDEAQKKKSSNSKYNKYYFTIETKINL